jgi:hypothetical protein
VGNGSGEALRVVGQSTIAHERLDPVALLLDLTSERIDLIGLGDVEFGKADFAVRELRF